MRKEKPNKCDCVLRRMDYDNSGVCVGDNLCSVGRCFNLLWLDTEATVMRIAFITFLVFSIPVFRYNLHIHGLCRWIWLVMYSGMLCNWLAIASNGWRMPVMCPVGYHIETGASWKIAVNPRLPWLIDRFACSTAIFSVGDVLIYTGLACTIGLCTWTLTRG